MCAEATQQGFTGSRNESGCANLSRLSCVRGVCWWRFQRKKSEPIGVKAPPDSSNCSGFLDRERCRRRTLDPRNQVRRLPRQVHLANEAVRIFTRRGHDWTHRFRRSPTDAWHIKAASAVIDGEIVVPAADGTTDFSVLQNELKGQSTKIVMVAFDLLYLNGRDLRSCRFTGARPSSRRSSPAPTSSSANPLEIDGHAMFEHACKVGLEASYPRSVTAPIRWGAQLGPEDLSAGRDADDCRLRTR